MTIVAITGMHRSGTSMLARVLNLAGLYLGPEKDIYDPGLDNPDGFWENKNFVDLNNQLLNHYQGAWDVPPAMPLDWEKSADLISFKMRAVDLVNQFGGHDHWGWKDPRSSLTMRFWKSVLPRLKVVICVRNPMEVFHSLNKRGYASSNFAFKLWQEHYERLLAAVPDEDRLITHFDSYFENPGREVERVLGFIGISPSESELNRALASIRATSRHTRASAQDLWKQAPSYDLVALYQELCAAAGPNYEAVSGGDVVYSRDDWNHYRALQSSVVYRGLMQKNDELHLLEQRIVEKEKAIEELTQKLKDSHDQILNSDQRANALNLELQDIKSGMIWQLHLLRNRLGLTLPRGYGRRLASIIQIMSSEGLRGLWVRVGNRFRARQSLRSTRPEKFMDVYSELISTALKTKTEEYVPISGQEIEPGNAPVKLLAFYLPQFHPIPENDAWWGKGFTEWTNVSKAIPQFVGHYQPHLPGELGFYDLRVPDVQYRQVELARTYGISGFCFYYYWFHGRRLLEGPLERFMNDPKIDFPFCLCWANENWTRRWDGQENEILIGQEHSVESDLQFIRDVAPIFKHKNYIRINGRPVLVVYRANILPDPGGTAERWKAYCNSIGLEEPYLIAAQTFYFEDPTEINFDAAVQFPPHSKSQVGINDKLQFLNKNYRGNVVNYADAWPIFGDFSKKVDYNLFRTVFPSWDNESRKPGQGYTFAFSTPAEYQAWLMAAIRSTLANDRLTPDERIVFINAWNEWAEGAHLEPDRRFGYAYLQATRDALNNIQPGNGRKSMLDEKKL